MCPAEKFAGLSEFLFTDAALR
eukprot:SAG31_NODE_44984_length_260_cov_1.173913_1_plen_21_part_01